MVLISFFVLAVSLELASSANVLFVLPVPSRSHQYAIQPIYKELSLRGYKVTTMSVYPMKDPSLTNLTEIDWNRTDYLIRDVFQLYRKIQEEKFSMQILWYAIEVFKNVTEEQFLHPDVQDLTTDTTRKFDLVIVENFALSYYFFAEKYDCPIILVSSLPIMTYNLNVMGIPDHPVVYHDKNLGFGSSLTFYERIFSVVYSFWFDYQLRWIMIPAINPAQKRFGLDGLSVEELERKRGSLLIEISIPVFHKQRPLTEDVVRVNGLHINPPGQLVKVGRNSFTNLYVDTWVCSSTYKKID